MIDDNDSRFWEVQWDEVNLRHAGCHGLNAAITKAVLSRDPRVFDNTKDEGKIVIGPERRGRFWTIIFARPTAVAGE
jgi:hypothetical protein